MNSNSNDNDSNNIRVAADDSDDLRKSLQHAVSKIIFEEDRKHNTRTSPSAMSTLSELVFQYATKSLIPDLYAFSLHASRKSSITPDDVALVLRKLPSDQLEEFKMNFCTAGSSSNKNSSISSSVVAIVVENE